MIYALMTIVSLMPVIILGYYIYHKDTVKEPKTLLLGLFASGFLSAFLVVIINIALIWFFPQHYILSDISKFSTIEIFGLIFLEVALLEEFSKWLMTRIFAYKSKEFDQFFDIIVYSVFISLGFAAVENIFYVVPEAKLGVGILRAVFSVPAHAAFGVFMGYFFARAKMQDGYNKSKYLMNMLSAVMVPTLFHAIYNFLLIKDNILYLIIFLIFIVLVYIVSIIEVNRASKSGTMVK